jgi:hypothetical protein
MASSGKGGGGSTGQGEPKSNDTARSQIGAASRGNWNPARNK